MKTVFILNDAPYGTERDYNALRLATTLLEREGEEARVFLMADAAACARAGQTLPQGYYNLELMLQLVRIKGGDIGVCGSCMDAGGMGDAELVERAHRGNMEELADWTQWADNVLVF
jgi:uncharacterized protein involved in oxidation of intracellular sulfur